MWKKRLILSLAAAVVTSTLIAASSVSRAAETSVNKQGSSPRIVLTAVDLAGGCAAATEDLEGDPLVSIFEAIPDRAVFRPALQTPRPRIEGLQTATVTGPDGAEVCTDHLGRVQIRFQWERPSAARTTPCWVRVLQGPWAGAG